MSIKGIPEGDRLYKKSNHHWRNGSDELDVFEAAQYFSGGTQSSGFDGAILSHQHQKPMIIRDERKARGGRRTSLDLPTVMRTQLPNSQHGMEKQNKENKKCKQPSSPGAKLASFFNSLLNQTSSKKKKSSSSSKISALKDDQDKESQVRRKRRSSISHFQSFNINTISTDHSKSPLYSSSLSAGFRTPPPYSTATKISSKDSRSTESDHRSQRQMGSDLSKCSGRVSSISLQDLKNRDRDFSWMELDEKFKFINGFSEKNKKFSSSEQKDERRVVDQFIDADDGGESDSSSDLFELPNHDLGGHNSSSGLPVFEATHIENIKREPPISSN